MLATFENHSEDWVWDRISMKFCESNSGCPVDAQELQIAWERRSHAHNSVAGIQEISPRNMVMLEVWCVAMSGVLRTSAGRSKQHYNIPAIGAVTIWQSLGILQPEFFTKRVYSKDGFVGAGLYLTPGQWLTFSRDATRRTFHREGFHLCRASEGSYKLYSGIYHPARTGLQFHPGGSSWAMPSRPLAAFCDVWDQVTREFGKDPCYELALLYSSFVEVGQRSSKFRSNVEEHPELLNQMLDLAYELMTNQQVTANWDSLVHRGICKVDSLDEAVDLSKDPLHVFLLSGMQRNENCANSRPRFLEFFEIRISSKNTFLAFVPSNGNAKTVIWGAPPKGA